MKYKVNDVVIHKTHGMGVVTGIETREFSPENISTFYILTIEDCGAPKKVFVPLSSAGERLRSLVSKVEAENVLNSLNTSKDVIDQQTWNRRYREYMELVHTGDIQNLAKVFNSLMRLLLEKDLSFGERKLLDQAKTLLVKELSYALDKSETEVENTIEALYAKPRLKLVK